MRLPLSAFTLLAVLAASSPAVSADLVGRWTGVLHTLQGTCPGASVSTLVIDHKHLSFAPADGVLVLHGRIGPDPDRLHAQLALTGPDHKPFPMVFEGHPDGASITGLYGTPGCRAEIRLRRPVEHPLQNLLGR